MRLSQKGQPLPVFYGILIRNVLIYCVKDARLLPKYPIELNEKGLMRHPHFQIIVFAIRIRQNALPSFIHAPHGIR